MAKPKAKVSKTIKSGSAPLFKGMGKSLADSAKPERSGGWRNTPLAKTATNQDYAGASKPAMGKTGKLGKGMVKGMGGGK